MPYAHPATHTPATRYIHMVGVPHPTRRRAAHTHIHPPICHMAGTRSAPHTCPTLHAPAPQSIYVFSAATYSTARVPRTVISITA